MAERTAEHPVPAGASAITAPWLTSVLRSAGALHAPARVASVSARPVEVGGVNGDVHRLTVEYERGAGPPTLIAKFPAASPGARRVAAFQGWHIREAGAYRELALPGDLLMPRCYFAAAGGPGSDGEAAFLLVLEDLGHLRQGDQLAGCSLSEAEEAVHAVARLHARWWAHPALESHPWLPLTTVGLDRAAAVQGALARAWDAVSASYALPKGIAPAALNLIDAYPDLLAHAAAPPLTVVHGDYRLDNLFFHDDGSVTAIDWQFVCRCRSAYDIAYFLGLDLSPEQRRAGEEQLLQSYVDLLADLGVEGYGIDECRRDYALYLLLAFATFVIGAAGPQATERTRRVHEVGLTRLAYAIMDHREEAPAA